MFHNPNNGRRKLLATRVTRNVDLVAFRAHFSLPRTILVIVLADFAMVHQHHSRINGVWRAYCYDWGARFWFSRFCVWEKRSLVCRWGVGAGKGLGLRVFVLNSAFCPEEWSGWVEIETRMWNFEEHGKRLRKIDSLICWNNNWGLKFIPWKIYKQSRYYRLYWALHHITHHLFGSYVSKKSSSLWWKSRKKEDQNSKDFEICSFDPRVLYCRIVSKLRMLKLCGAKWGSKYPTFGICIEEARIMNETWYHTENGYLISYRNPFSVDQTRKGWMKEMKSLARVIDL